LAYGHNKAVADAYVRGAGVKIDWGKGGAPPSAPKLRPLQEMFDDYCRIAALLTDRERCKVHLKKLNREMAEELALTLVQKGVYNPKVPRWVALVDVKKYGENWVNPDQIEQSPNAEVPRRALPSLGAQ